VEASAMPEPTLLLLAVEAYEALDLHLGLRSEP